MALKVPIRIKGDQSTTGLEAERIFNTTEWLTLHSRTSSALKILVTRALKSYELGVTEWEFLDTLANDKNGTLTVTQLAQMFDMNTPQATIIVGYLIKRSLVRQKVSVKDRRVRYLSTTRSGRRLAYDANQSIHNAMRYWLFDLSDKEIEQYLTIQKKILEFDIPGQSEFEN